MNTKTIEQVIVTIKTGKKSQSYTVDSSKVVGNVWSYGETSSVVDSVRPTAPRTVFVSTAAQQARVNESSCDAQFNENTGMMEFSAR